MQIYFFYLTQSEYTDNVPTSPSADPITPGTYQGNHLSAKFEVTGMTRFRKFTLSPEGIEPRTFRSRGGRLSPWPCTQTPCTTTPPRLLVSARSPISMLKPCWARVKPVKNKRAKEATACPSHFVFYWLLHVPATSECSSGADLHRQAYVLPHRDRSCRWHFQPDQSQHRPSNARRQAGRPLACQCLSHWYDSALKNPTLVSGIEPGTFRS